MVANKDKKPCVPKIGDTVEVNDHYGRVIESLFFIFDERVKESLYSGSAYQFSLGS